MKNSPAKPIVLLVLFLLLGGSLLRGQGRGLVTGRIVDSTGQGIELAHVSIRETSLGTLSDGDGNFRLDVPAGKPVELTITCVGFVTKTLDIHLKPGEERQANITLSSDVTSINEVSVSARQDRTGTFQRIPVEDLMHVPTATGRVEALIKSQAGVSSNNELSTQYSVRGGNFDENLVYVNDIEIYRPFLVRSGQQEGLGFVNSDLVSSVKFSAGGFDARYGDKMSSALDIQYKVPREFRASSSVSLLGASAHVEGISAGNRLTYLAGFRYKTTAYLLNTLQTQGDYKPRFTDFQALLRYRLGPKLELSFLGNSSTNRYLFVPRETDVEFGTKDLPLHLKIYYEGQEEDRFRTYLGALNLTYEPRNDLSLKFTATAFRTAEQESFDILGQYWINELDNTIGSDTYGDSILNVGVGGLLTHARNSLDAIVLSASHLGQWQSDNGTFLWGLEYRYQDFLDRISEWELTDSSGYVIPYNGEMLELSKARYARNLVAYDQISGFGQYTHEVPGDRRDWFLTAGIRALRWNHNPSTRISPRFSLSMQPRWEKDILFHLSGGFYYQAPFYREMRRPDGSINPTVEPQRSIQVLFGGDYLFELRDRPFKFSGELYYKWLDNLIPYKIDNVRISYAGENLSSGYARGIDFKLNGDFVPGAESWMTLSLLQVREDIPGDSAILWDGTAYVEEEAGFFPRPTDQLFTFGMYFQDYLPNSPEYKVHLNAFFGSGLPLSSPNPDQYYSTHRMGPYRRVDIGFSRVLRLEWFESIWISGEIFNLLGIKNEASYLWIRTIADQSGFAGQFAVPNYLTGRRFNLRITATF
ncbi:MAG: carboxypeptidase-like regulatory domain-containing protein [Bacteroidales bacterium]